MVSTAGRVRKVKRGAAPARRGYGMCDGVGRLCHAVPNVCSGACRSSPQLHPLPPPHPRVLHLPLHRLCSAMLLSHSSPLPRTRSISTTRMSPRKAASLPIHSPPHRLASLVRRMQRPATRAGGCCAIRLPYVAALRRYSSGVSQNNLTSLTNAQNNVDEVHLWERNSGRSMPKGIPRKQRTEMTPITVLHESPHVIVAGRSRCNHFFSNQFLIASKKSNEAVLVDASDDWADDWVAFLVTSNVMLKYIFLTHCHIDNIINLSPLLQCLQESPVAADLKIAWCSNGEDYWVRQFPRACERYRRFEMKDAPLPLLDLAQQPCSSSARVGAGGEVRQRTPDVYNYFLNRNVILSTATNRATSFLQIGNTLLFYMFSPGHSPGHMMLHVPQEKLLFSGDLLFYNAVGRVDLPYASGEVLAQSLRTLEDLPDNTVVLPGHGRMTSLGRERRHNRALRSLYERMEFGSQAVRVGYNNGYL